MAPQLSDNVEESIVMATSESELVFPFDGIDKVKLQEKDASSLPLWKKLQKRLRKSIWVQL